MMTKRQYLYRLLRNAAVCLPLVAVPACSHLPEARPAASLSPTISSLSGRQVDPSASAPTLTITGDDDFDGEPLAQLDGRLTDPFGILGNRASEVQAELDNLGDIPLHLVYVPTFGNYSPDDWAKKTASNAGLNGNEILLAFATNDFKYGVAFSPEYYATQNAGEKQPLTNIDCSEGGNWSLTLTSNDLTCDEAREIADKYGEALADPNQILGSGLFWDFGERELPLIDDFISRIAYTLPNPTDPTSEWATTGINNAISINPLDTAQWHCFRVPDPRLDGPTYDYEYGLFCASDPNGVLVHGGADPEPSTFASHEPANHPSGIPTGAIQPEEFRYQGNYGSATYQGFTALDDEVTCDFYAGCVYCNIENQKGHLDDIPFLETDAPAANNHYGFVQIDSDGTLFADRVEVGSDSGMNETHNPIPSGTTLTLDGVACQVDDESVDCWSVATDHGFRITPDGLWYW